MDHIFLKIGLTFIPADFADNGDPIGPFKALFTAHSTVCSARGWTGETHFDSKDSLLTYVGKELDKLNQ